MYKIKPVQRGLNVAGARVSYPTLEHILRYFRF